MAKPRKLHAGDSLSKQKEWGQEARARSGRLRQAQRSAVFANKRSTESRKKRCLAAAFGPAQGEETLQQRENGEASIYALVAAFGQAQG